MLDLRGPPPPPSATASAASDASLPATGDYGIPTHLPWGVHMRPRRPRPPHPTSFSPHPSTSSSLPSSSSSSSGSSAKRARPIGWAHRPLPHPFRRRPLPRRVRPHQPAHLLPPHHVQRPGRCPHQRPRRPCSAALRPSAKPSLVSQNHRGNLDGKRTGIFPVRPSIRMPKISSVMRQNFRLFKHPNVLEAA